MKQFWLDLREHATKIISYEKNEMIPLTKEEKKLIVLLENALYAKERSLVLMMTIKNIIKLEIIDTILGNVEVLLMIFAT